MEEMRHTEPTLSPIALRPLIVPEASRLARRVTITLFVGLGDEEDSRRGLDFQGREWPDAPSARLSSLSTHWGLRLSELLASRAADAAQNGLNRSEGRTFGAGGQKQEDFKCCFPVVSLSPSGYPFTRPQQSSTPHASFLFARRHEPSSQVAVFYVLASISFWLPQ